MTNQVQPKKKTQFQSQILMLLQWYFLKQNDNNSRAAGADDNSGWMLWENDKPSQFAEW